MQHSGKSEFFGESLGNGAPGWEGSRGGHTSPEPVDSVSREQRYKSSHALASLYPAHHAKRQRLSVKRLLLAGIRAPVRRELARGRVIAGRIRVIDMRKTAAEAKGPACQASPSDQRPSQDSSPRGPAARPRLDALQANP